MNEYIKKAEGYLRDCLFDGLAHSYSVNGKKYVKPYPEVTGYVIKYFCDNKVDIDDKVIEAGYYLIDIQDKVTGGYLSFYNQDLLFVFDTAQIVRGLCALYYKTKNEIFLDASIKGANFILSSQEKNGALKPIYNKRIGSWVIRDETYSMWNGPFSGLMCKPAECLYDMYYLTNNEKYLEAAKRIGSFYAKAKYIECSHPLGYWLEGMLVTSYESSIDEIIEKKILSRIEKNGFIAYTNKLNYAYVSGTVQLGIILYKRGYIEEALKIRDYGRSVQEKHISGGLFQYANNKGELVTEVHDEINSWGTKYFCELERLLED